MAWNRKHRRIQKLEAELVTAYEQIADEVERTAFAERVAVDAVEGRDGLLQRVGDMLAKHAPDQLAAEWDAAKCGDVWRDERRRFLPKDDRYNIYDPLPGSER